MQHRSFLIALARSFLAGEPTVDEIVARSIRTMRRSWRWLRPLARRYVTAFKAETRPRVREVIQFLLQDAGFQRAQSEHFHKLTVAQWLTEPQAMQPVESASGWNLPAIETAGDLAHWLGLEPGELENWTGSPI